MTIDEIMGMDKERLSNKDTFLSVLSVQEPFERQTLVNAIRARAKDLKCAQAIGALIKAMDKELRDIVRADSGERMTSFGCPFADEYYCGGWIADNDGARISTLTGDEVACYHPILPLERLYNIETHTEKVKIAYKRNGKWLDITVDKIMIASANKIVGLASFGVAVTSENARWLVRFLADLENFNDIPVRDSTSKLGWNGETFLPYDNAVMFDGNLRFTDMVDAIGSRGSRDAWMDAVKEIRKSGRPEPCLLMAASFASVMLKPLNLLPFVFNLCGKTGCGKTVAMMLATSIWADPGDHKYLVEVEATQVGFEVRMDVLNHLPLMIDDFSKIEDKFKDKFTDLIYMLTSGRGKDRATPDLGLRAAKTWHNATIGAMERPLTNDRMRGGAINRVLDFSAGEGLIFEDPGGLLEIIKGNYGFAGKDFVSLMREIGVEQLQDMRKEIEAKIRQIAWNQGAQKEDKQIIPLSAILLADRLAADRIFEDGIYLDVGSVARQLAGTEETSDYLRSYEFIMSWVQVHIKEFDGNNDPERRNGPVYGFFRDDYVCIFSSAMERIANEGSFSIRAFYRDAKQEGTVDCDEANNYNKKVVKYNGKSVRVYKIKMEIHEEAAATEDFKDIPEEIQETLPFV